jgi:hypothetical protein
MLRAALPLRRSAFRALFSGRAASLTNVAVAAGSTPEEARSAAQEVAAVAMAEVNDGTVIGMDGLTTRPTDTASLLTA